MKIESRIDATRLKRLTGGVAAFSRISGLDGRFIVSIHATSGEVISVKSDMLQIGDRFEVGALTLDDEIKLQGMKMHLLKDWDCAGIEVGLMRNFKVDPCIDSGFFLRSKVAGDFCVLPADAPYGLSIVCHHLNMDERPEFPLSSYTKVLIK